MTKQEIDVCDYVSAVIVAYRDNCGAFSVSVMEEWALGYLCALRDVGMIGHEQWEFLCEIFQPDL